MELCFRIKKAGYKIYYFPYTGVRHEGQGSSDRSFAITNIYKGLRYFYRKHRSAFAYIVVSTLLLLKAFVAIIIGIITRNKELVLTYKKAIQMFLCMLVFWELICL